MKTLSPIPEAEIGARIAVELEGWRFAGGSLRRTYATDGWPTTMMLVNAIGFLSEAAWHHPDLEIGYRRVEVRLRTHDADGITERDFALAREIDRLVLWEPPAGGPLPGPPRRRLHPVEE